jgi:hypothetical protein
VSDILRHVCLPSSMVAGVRTLITSTTTIC